MPQHFDCLALMWSQFPLHAALVALLYVLGDGVKRKQEREELIESGRISEVDLPKQI